MKKSSYLTIRRVSSGYSLLQYSFLHQDYWIGLLGVIIGSTNIKSCNETQILGVSASASENSFPASAVLDLNPQTLWSTYGKGAWLQFDLGNVKTVCSLDIAWYKGNQRNVNFIISVSKDGSTYKNIFDSKSSGTTTSFEDTTSKM